MISHYATGGPGQHLLPGLEEATSDDKSPVLVFILTVNNDWSQVYLSEEPGDNCLTSGQGSYKIDQGSGLGAYLESSPVNNPTCFCRCKSPKYL